MSSYQAALAAYDRRDFQAAAAAARAALRAAPADARGLEVLAAALTELGELTEAVQAWQALADAQPQQPGHWLNLGVTLREQGALQQALAACEQAVALGADGPDLHLNLGLLCLDLGRSAEAHQHLEQAYALDSGDAEIAYAYAHVCYLTVRQKEAIAAARAWRSWRALSESLLPALGTLLLQLGETDEAETVLRLALTINEGEVESRTRLASLMERINRLDDAAAELRKCRASALSAGQALECLAVEAKLAQRAGRHEEAVAGYQAVFASRGQGTDAQDLHFALAKSLDALGRFDEAHAALQAAHAAQMQQLALYTPKLAQGVESLRIANFSAQPEDIAQWLPSKVAAAQPERSRLDPLFVVAFPRSGTTLLEQMLDAHPGLRSMDEQPFLQLAIQDLQTQGAQYPEALAGLNEAQLESARAGYWQRVSEKLQLAPDQRLVDKNPLNLLRLPAIRRLFPDAPIVLVIRHPCDVILSCYMQPFRAPEFAALCQSLESLAKGYVKAFDFWYAQQALLKARVLELRYEILVENVEASARQLCAFAGLPWNAAMLDPALHAQKRGYISTPSYSQVVKPVHNKAVNRWRNYARHFAPVLPALAPYLQRWSYEN